MSSNKEKTQNSIYDEELELENWLKVFDNKIRFRISQLLFVYGELSLTELSRQMNKSKPALYHHLQKMIKLKIIKVSKEKPARGSIKSKHYCLTKKSPFLLQLFIDEDLSKIKNPDHRLKALENVIASYRNSISLLRNKLDIIDLYIDHLDDELENKEKNDLFHHEIPKLISNFNVGFQALYLTENQYKEFMIDYSELKAKYKNMALKNGFEENIKNDDITEHPYFVTTLTLPLKNLLELELMKMKGSNNQ